MQHSGIHGTTVLPLARSLPSLLRTSRKAGARRLARRCSRQNVKMFFAPTLGWILFQKPHFPRAECAAKPPAPTAAHSPYKSRWTCGWYSAAGGKVKVYHGAEREKVEMYSSADWENQAKGRTQAAENLGRKPGTHAGSSTTSR